MDTETVLAQILPKVTGLLKALVAEVAQGERPTLYALEERTQRVVPQVGQVVLQALVAAQGSGLEGPERACSCGGRQRYHDRHRPLEITSSLGPITLEQRAYYRCPECQAHALPLDEQLGLGAAGRMSRYLQEQCGWLLALLPARLARQTLERFGWPAIAASQVREHGEALGAELEQREQQHQAQARVAAAGPPAGHGPARQPPTSDRLYAAPDGVMYCTTAQDPQTGKALWRELKVAAVYEREARAAAAAPAPRGAAGGPAGARERIVRHLQRQQPPPLIAPADQAVHVSYVAETGPWQDFGGRLWAELWARGLGRPVQDLAVVADGSTHIDQAVDAELRVSGVQLTRILDLAHAHQHLWTVAHAAFGEGSAAGAAWVQPIAAALEHGDVNAVLDALEQVVSQAADPAAHTARQARDYFAARRDQLTYSQFVAAGYQIGSGLAESACKRFGTDRMKGAGMRWTVPGAQAVATLRMLVLSDRWDEVTGHCRQAA
jgi:hypothetical protein